ncbi:MG2 domain-containing protein [Desulfovibrio sp. 86]|uniref:Alpha-2-macroglobulin domain protein n=1 Tax=uncultured Desulfovibrio sp. TaxID=167968 RepID=A0A212KYG9_9BACT|nr:MG2 domain-containing protein [Desulfovibrio sp. 86]SCM70313.1 Alpha-2-macroglobulin domain protein [uncultured Desulfovibrio sp.]VZH32199.1 Alpha-2-macroglobulin domain protein [Desulfovibrio sp. 86]
MIHKFIVYSIAVCMLITSFAAAAVAGPAYRIAETSRPESDSWKRSDGFSISFEVDIERCKRQYGSDWSRQCSAPPAGQEGRLVEGVHMTPAVPGQWRWSYGSTMSFLPEKPLSPQTTYSISLDKVPLPSRFEVNRQVRYTTQPQAVRIGKETFWIDPSPKGAHALSVPVHFMWPVNPQSMEGNISLRPSDAKSGLALGAPRFVWNERRDEVVVSAVVTSLPKDNAAAVISVKGLPGFIEKNNMRMVKGSGGKGQGGSEALLYVTGRDRIMNVSDIGVRVAYDTGLDKEFHLVVKTSLRVLPSEVLRYLDVVQLPRTITPEAGQEANWAKMPAISATDIANGEKLQPKLVQAADEPTDQVVLRVKAASGRGLLAAVKPGLTSTGGLSLSDVRRFILTVPGMGAELSFLQPGNILALSGDKKLDIYALGLTEIDWRAERVREPFMALLAKDGSFEEPEADFTVLSDAVQGHINVRKGERGDIPGQAFFGVLDLAPLLQGQGGLRHGLMRMVLTGRNGDKQVAEATRLLLVTDMGLSVKTASDGTRAVFVQNIATGKPVSNAEVRLLGANGLPVCSAVTNAQGRADLPSTVGLEREKRPVALVALAPAQGGGQDMAWLSLDDSARTVDYSNFSVSGRHAASNGLSASVFSQRGLYLPGETLHFGCVIRRFDWQALPENLPLEAVLTNPAGTEVMRRSFTVGPEGLQNFTWASSEDAAVGQYRMDIRLASDKPGYGGPVLGSVTTRVEEFQPDTLALATSFESSAPKGWIRTGENMPPAMVLARLDNLYGEPAASHRIHAAFHARKGLLRFPGYEDYAFYDALSGSVQDQYMDLPDVFTDPKGLAKLALPLGKLQGSTFYGTVLIEGFEPTGGRAVTRQVSALFSPLEVALGYKPEGQANNLDYVPQNAKASLRFLAVNNDLAPTALRDAEIVFSARRYVNSLVTDSRGEYRYDATPVDTEITRQTVSLDAKGLAWPLPTAEAGDYLVTVRQNNGHVLALVPFSVAGTRLAEPSDLSTRSLAKGNLRLKLEKEQYAPGDTIKMSLSTPYSGTGLITIERENVLTHAWLTAQAGESVQEIRIPEGFEGRGYVNVSFVRSLGSEAIYMNPHSFGVAPFTAGASQRNMGLKLNAPARVLPGEKITVRVSSRVPGKALLFAVDEGVLQLTGFTTPDPLNDLLNDRALDVATMQAFDLLMPDHARLQGRIPGFGGDMAGAGGRFLNPFKRRGEPPFAFWQELAAVNADGTDVTLTIPEYVSGRIRIMAVGSSAARDGASTAGNAQTSTEVRGTLILKPLLPLAVAPGDEFDGALVIANTVEGSGKDARVAVKMECGPELVFLSGQNPLPLEINENGEAVLRFRMRAQDRLGSADVRFTANLEGKGKPGSVRNQSLSVRPPAPRVRTEQVVPLTDSMNVSVDRDIYPYEAQGQASVSALPLLGLRSLLDRLDTYPYGCTEQLISRAMPYAALLGNSALREKVLLDPKASPETLAKRGNAVISAALATIRSNFSYYEGVSLWPSAPANDFVTAYAGDFLLTLRESGVVVPEGLARNILDTLENTVRSAPVDIDDGRVKVYGAWVLLRDGRIMTQEVERLEQWFRENTNGWDKELVAALLADCYKMLRMERRAQQRMPVTFTAVTTDNMLDEGAARALHAAIILRHYPERRKEVNVAALLDSAFNTTATTVDMGLLSRALILLAEKKAPAPVGIELTCTRYGQDFAPAAGKAELLGSILELNAPGCLAYNVKLPKGDSGWNLHTATEGFERKPLTAAANGLELQRRYLNNSGEAVTSAKLGEVLTVELTVRSADEYSNVVLVDLLPGGLEPVLEKSGKEAQQGLIRHERREDRGIFFVNSGLTPRTFTYKVRAATRGRFVLPSATAEAMYEPAINARLGGGQMIID